MELKGRFSFRTTQSASRPSVMPKGMISSASARNDPSFANRDISGTTVKTGAKASTMATGQASHQRVGRLASSAP